MAPALQSALTTLARQEVARQQEYGWNDAYCRECAMEDFEPVPEGCISWTIRGAPQVGDLNGPSNHWLYLPAPKKGPLRVPLLNFLWDYRENKFSFQVAVYYPHPRPDEHQPLARAWRFESPEGAGSIHEFFHAQPGYALRTLKLGDVPVPSVDQDVPQGQPTFPLDAADELDLLVCLLISIYGIIEARWWIENIDEPDLTDRLEKLRCAP
jgi:hypothetical protein